LTTEARILTQALPIYKAVESSIRIERG